MLMMPWVKREEARNRISREEASQTKPMTANTPDKWFLRAHYPFLNIAGTLSLNCIDACT